jgi:tRNA-dihydrouridine synthase
VILHPRFFEDKFKRRARHELIPWAASLTRLPLIANGDLIGPEHAGALADRLRPACAIMLGRMAVARPWIFATWDVPSPVDLAAIWHTARHHLAEDFPPGPALRRLKMFTKYFAANFVFGHQFNVSILNAASLEDASRRAEEFFSGSPAMLTEPTLAGR